jgi:hypothetical protein
MDGIDRAITDDMDEYDGTYERDDYEVLEYALED